MFLFQGKSTIKSDVWSFAITLWEILTFAREQPFENLSDEKVIENFGHIYQDDKKHVSISMYSFECVLKRIFGIDLRLKICLFKLFPFFTKFESNECARSMICFQAKNLEFVIKLTQQIKTASVNVYRMPNEKKRSAYGRDNTLIAFLHNT